MNNKLKHTIINYLNKEYPELVRYETDKYPDFIFFMKDDKVIFYYNKINGWGFISYDKIWSFLDSFFGLNDMEIKDLTKQWMEEHYKLDMTTTFLFNLTAQKKVEEHYKLDTTPFK
jgi:hypothetical protein